MTSRVRKRDFFAQRKERMLGKMQKMREAKARRRIERGAALPQSPECEREKFFPLQLGVRDKRTGEEAWTDFVSLRDALRRLTVIQRYYH